MNEQPVPTKKRGHKGLWIVLGLVVLIGICGAVVLGSGGGKSGTTGNVSTKDNPVNAASAAASTKAPDPNTISGDGTFAVPSQVKPGTYRAVVPNDSLCYYERLKDATGSFDSIIANDTGDAGSQKIVEIKVTDKFFKTEGCGTWTKVG